MRRTDKAASRFVIILAIAAIVPAIAGPAPASDPAPSGSAGPAGPPAARSIAGWVPAEASSPKPTSAEWASATPLALLRPHALCKASVVREWARISCLDEKKDFIGARVVGGAHEDVSLDNFTVEMDDAETKKKKKVHGIHLQFPVRRGDRRLIAIERWESGGWKSFYIREDTFIMISELWLAGEAGPTVVVH